MAEFLSACWSTKPRLYPAERVIAKRWVKERLKKMYPELRSDPRALERAYRELSLEPHDGAGEGGEIEFEVVLPGKLNRCDTSWNGR